MQRGLIRLINLNCPHLYENEGTYDKKKVEKWSSRRSFATTVSHFKMCDFSEDSFKGFEVL